jgi:phage gpG-like protein
MAYGLRAIVSGTGRGAGVIRELRDRAQDLSPIGDPVHRAFLAQTKRVFHQNGAPLGVRWPGYTGTERAYGVIKKAMLGREAGRQLLRWEPGNERLYPSLVSPMHPEHIWRVEGNDFVYGTSVPYAKKHQEGRGRGPSWAGFPKVKARPMIGVTMRTAAEITRIMRRHMGL